MTTHAPAVRQSDLNDVTETCVRNGFSILITKAARTKLFAPDHIAEVERIIDRYVHEPEGSHSLGRLSIPVCWKGSEAEANAPTSHLSQRDRGLRKLRIDSVALYLSYRNRHVIILSHALPFPCIDETRAEEIMEFCVPYDGFKSD